MAFGLYFVVGRFFVKAYSKRHTRYFLTTRRAVVVRPRAEAATDLVPGLTRITNVHGKRIDVTFGANAGPLAALPNSAMLRVYANTGLDFFAAMGPGRPTAFYDVTDIQGLKAALQNVDARQH